MDRLKQWLQGYPNARILDVGCGVGNFIHLLLEAGAQNANITGIDVSATAIEAAKKHFQENSNIAFVQGDILDSPFAAQSFDIVCLSNTLHHLEKPTEVFAAMRTLLKPGGSLFINEMISDGLSDAQLSHRKLHHFAAEIDRAMGVYHAPTYTRGELKRKLHRLTGSVHIECWDLTFGEMPVPSKEEVAQLASTVDRLLSRVHEEAAMHVLAKKGQRIKNYLTKHSFAGATQVAAAIQF
jgi:ubiquinone/menaquinone biosynthesis C-methylase UbiE